VCHLIGATHGNRPVRHPAVCGARTGSAAGRYLRTGGQVCGSSVGPKDAPLSGQTGHAGIAGMTLLTPKVTRALVPSSCCKGRAVAWNDSCHHLIDQLAGNFEDSIL
jgi:hypothetical protein